MESTSGDDDLVLLLLLGLSHSVQRPLGTRMTKNLSQLLLFLGGSVLVLGCGTFEVDLQSTHPTRLADQ